MSNRRGEIWWDYKKHTARQKGMVDIMTWLADRNNKRKKAGYPYKMQDNRLQMYLSSLWNENLAEFEVHWEPKVKVHFFVARDEQWMKTYDNRACRSQMIMTSLITNATLSSEPRVRRIAWMTLTKRMNTLAKPFHTCRIDTANEVKAVIRVKLQKVTFVARLMRCGFTIEAEAEVEPL